MAKKLIFWGTGIVLVFVALFLFSSTNADSFETLDNYQGEMTIYKSESCGCCEVYSTYFKNKGNSNVKIVNSENMNALKQRYGIPPMLESCHTTIIGKYFVEGHIPLEAVERLMKEKPDIQGIAMPGMPSGSPGMPGSKKSDFVIFAINNDGSYTEWMRI